MDLTLTGASGGRAGPDKAPTGRRVSAWETRIRLMIDHATSLPDTITFRDPVRGLEVEEATLRLRDYGVDVEVAPPSSVADQPFDPDALLPD